MNKCTQGFECLVVNNTSRSNEIDDCIFWYKAELRDNFKIGKSQMWYYHYQMKKQEEIENEDENDYYQDLVGINAQNIGRRNLVVKKMY